MTKTNNTTQQRPFSALLAYAYVSVLDIDFTCKVTKINWKKKLFLLNFVRLQCVRITRMSTSWRTNERTGDKEQNTY